MSTTVHDRPAGEGAAASVAPAPSWGALAALLVGVFVVTLDFFIVNVAIPSVQHSFHAEPATIQFVVAGFGLAYSCSLITGGRLGDLFGRRRVYAIGLALFTIASAACGLAPSAGLRSRAGSCRDSPPPCSHRRCWPSSTSSTRDGTASGRSTPSVSRWASAGCSASSSGVC